MLAKQQAPEQTCGHGHIDRPDRSLLSRFGCRDLAAENWLSRGDRPEVQMPSHGSSEAAIHPLGSAQQDGPRFGTGGSRQTDEESGQEEVGFAAARDRTDFETGPESQIRREVRPHGHEDS